MDGKDKANPFGDGVNPFEKDRDRKAKDKDKEKAPPPAQLVAKPKPINPAWNEKKMAITWLSDLKEEKRQSRLGRFGKNGMMGYKPNGNPNRRQPDLDGQATLDQIPSRFTHPTTANRRAVSSQSSSINF